MSEIRRDYFTERLVIISAERSKRPNDFKHQKEPEATSTCPFCPGNESMTPPAELVLTQRGGSLVKLKEGESESVTDWIVRMFLNKYPALTTTPPQTYGDSLQYSEPGYGYHYVAVATPSHNDGFGRIDLDQWVNILLVLQDKVRQLFALKGVSYVSVFINHGKNAGASMAHPHLQILTLPQLPPLVEAESEAYQKSMDDRGVCPMCSIEGLEEGGPRQVLSTDHFLAFCPWAPTNAFEFWIYPKKHQTSLLKASQRETKDLALILRSTLGGLSAALDDPPFNLVFHFSSEKKTSKQIHWHIEVYPRLNIWGGLERGMGVFINPVAPEQAAADLGSHSRKELAKLIGII